MSAPVTRDVHYQYALGKRTLLPGTEVSIKDKTGRFRFQYWRRTGSGLDELTFVGGPLHGQGERFVSAYPERITRVHRINKTLTNIQREKRRGILPHS